MRTKTITVAVALPVRKTFSYIISDKFSCYDYCIGYAVLIPFGNQKALGFIIDEEDLIEKVELKEIKEIIDIIDPNPFFTKKMIPFFKWLSEYYFYPIGQVIKSALPSGLNIKRFITAIITQKGKKAVEELPQDSPERKSLIWIEQNPNKRLKIPLKIISYLYEKGWIRIKRQITKKSKTYMMRKFIKMKDNIYNIDNLCLSKNELHLLNLLKNKNEIPLFKIAKQIKNIYYITKKLEKKGLIESFYSYIPRDTDTQIITASNTSPKVLDQQQEKALLEIFKALKSKRFSSYLLFGVTGSGKTEVYLKASEMAINMGKQVILMVPEISLAIYIEALFKTKFGNKVAIYHSKLSVGERYDNWMRMIKGKVDVVIGARSALFAPLPRLGLIIVDEEHDPSYKQETPPYYQARDSALMRAQIEDSVVILGSGTPSIQSYYNTLIGKHNLIRMPKRVDNKPFPEIEIVDMKKEKYKSIFSQKLISEIKTNLDKKRQCILFLNKRGFYRLYVCSGCGSSIKCPNCEVSLVYHLKNEKLKCHYCGYNIERPTKCKKCGGTVFKTIGFGTERIEKELSMIFPDAKISRMDTDSTRKKGSSSYIIKKFINHNVDILVGTQMITKGYHFPKVTLVGIIHADISLLFPDFRAAEWTYQLLSQAAGRAGRGNQKGKVIIQTFNPEHYSIKATIQQDYELFFKKEKELRDLLKYPPFSYMLCIRFQSNHKQDVINTAINVSNEIKKIILNSPFKEDIQILGPIEAPIPKIKGKFRWQLIIKTKRPYQRHYILKKMDKITEQPFKSKGTSIIWDIDPYYMM